MANLDANLLTAKFILYVTLHHSLNDWISKFLLVVMIDLAKIFEYNWNKCTFLKTIMFFFP